MRFLLCLMLVSFPFSLTAHEMTPTYFVFKQSFVEGLHQTTLRMFNKRQEIEFYEIGVFDRDMKPIQFATSNSILRLPYLGKATFDIYVRAEDVKRVTYICSESKLKKGETVRTAITTKICSKIK